MRTNRKRFLFAAAGVVGATQISARAIGQTISAAGLPPVDRGAEPDMKVVLEQLLDFNEPPLPSLSPTVARELASFADALQAVLSRQGKPTVEPVAMIRHVVIAGPGGQLLVRIYKPFGNGPFPVTLYYHGGGFVIANLDTYDASARGLANAAGAIVVSVAYRQAPEHKFPAAVDDAFAAYLWVLKNASSFGGDPTRVAVSGESAGGNLAAVTAILARDKGAMPPVHQLLVYPVANFATNTKSYDTYANAFPLSKADVLYFGSLYLPTPGTAANPLASPLRADLHNLPSATIVNAQIDPLQDDGLLYATKLEAAGVAVNRHVYEGVTHEFFGMHAAVMKAQLALEFAAAGLKTAFNMH